LGAGEHERKYLAVGILVHVIVSVLVFYSYSKYILVFDYLMVLLALVILKIIVYRAAQSLPMAIHTKGSHCIGLRWRPWLPLFNVH